MKIERLRDKVQWRPQPRQGVFLQACGVLDWFLNGGPITAPLAEMMGYGGAAGGGKTDALLMLGLIIAHAFPGAKIAYFRRHYTELEGPDGAIQRSHELYAGLGKYTDDDHKWKFPNGSYLFFRHVRDERAKFLYQSQQFHVLIIDEATHFPWAIIDYLVTRNRSPIHGLKAFAAMGTNPGNIGHGWFSNLFDVHDHSGGGAGPHEQMKVRQSPNDKPERVYFVPARLEDNAILMANDPDYERKLEAREGDLSAALRWGDWQRFSGQAFRAWSRARHVIAPAMPHPSWFKWRAVDWGKRKPFCCLWFTRNPDTGRIYVYREAYATDLTDKAQARMIRDMTPPDEKIAITYADPSMWISKNYDGMEYCTADEYAAGGVALTRADNDRLSGKRKVDRLLADGADGGPGIQFTENCENLIRTMPLLVYDEARVEDIDTEQEDHAYDALKYGLTNYLIDVPAPQPRQPSPLEKLARHFGKRIARQPWIYDWYRNTRSTLKAHTRSETICSRSWKICS